jgi:hypothetical protein
MLLLMIRPTRPTLAEVPLADLSFDLKHIMNGISEAIELGLALPEEELPGGERHRIPPSQLTVLGQFLATAIAGKAALRIGDVRSHDPLVIERL